MKKKRGMLVIFGFLIIVSLVTALLAQDDNGPIDDAFSCLKEELGDDCGDTRNTEQVVFSLLAMSGDSSIRGDCKSSLNDKKEGDCWGETESGSCDLKSTALAVLGLNHAGENVDDEIEWMLGRVKKASGLNWFLEIDANNVTKCTIETDGNDKTFNIGNDKKISGSSTCLSPSADGYFLRIRDSCLEKEFSISCDRDFITTLFYKKTGEDVYHVSGETHGAPAYDSTEESVNSYCFTEGGDCDYEGSLWAVLALAKTGEEIKNYLAYLSANADEAVNRRYLPYAFLYMLTGDDEYYIKLVEQQKEGKYWEESGNKLYDTGLALLALQGLSIDEVMGTEEYLFDIQGDDGCWSNIISTAMIIYALDPSDAVSSGGSDDISYCEDFGDFCVSAEDCSLGNVLDNFYCAGLSDICCSVEPVGESCEDKGGIVCSSEQEECTGVEVSASNTNNCCLDSCQLVVTDIECESFDYSCKSSCGSGEEEKDLECNFGDVCCSEKEGGSYFWIIVLIILIILVVIGIIFRKKLREWMFKARNKIKIGKGPKGVDGRPMGLGRPRGVPPGMRPPLGQRPVMRGPVLRGGGARRVAKDKEFDETMRKLKEMSK